MLIYGHGTEAPDNRINSRESFLALQKLAVDGVELDVRLSQDGELLVLHDHSFADGRRVADTSSCERPSDIIFLREALDLCAGLIVNIEIKNYPSDPAFDPDEKIADRVVELLKSRGSKDRVLISSFGIGCLDRITNADPELETAHLVLSRRPASEVILACVGHGHHIVHPYVSMVDAEFMTVARSHELTVNAWTGFDESEKELQALFNLGIDGVITGYPERALRCRNHRS